jgi:RNA exonuclease 1
VLRAVTAETILIGHSLENDLRALKIVHMKCIDTCVMYPHPKGFPYRQSLKFIAKKYLEIDIQSYKTPAVESIEGAETPHCTYASGAQGEYGGVLPCVGEQSDGDESTSL